MKVWLSCLVWLPPVTQSTYSKQKLSSSITPAVFLAFIHVASRYYPKQYRHKNVSTLSVLLDSNVEAMIEATEDNGEQRRLWGPGTHLYQVACEDLVCNGDYLNSRRAVVKKGLFCSTFGFEDYDCGLETLFETD